jgi:hypothetical protein
MKWLLPLTLALLSSSCTTTGAPPERLAAQRIWTSTTGGFVFRVAYFSRGQIDDPRWEAKRLARMEQVQFCPGAKDVVRRQVRWYPATPISGRECAAVVYTVACRSPRLSSGSDRLDAIRRALLKRIPDPPIEPECGNKEPSAHAIARPQPSALTFSDSPVPCTDRRWQRGAMHLYPTTIGGAWVVVDRRLGKTIHPRVLTQALDDEAAGAFTTVLIRTPRPRVQFMKNGHAPEGAANIQIVERMAPHGDGYCIDLTARQGNSVWHRGIIRDTIEPIDTSHWGPIRRRLLAPSAQTRHARFDRSDDYYDPFMDTIALSAELLEHLDILDASESITQP